MSADHADSRDPIEQLAEQFIGEIRQGHPVTIEGYQKRYPEYGDSIKALFPTLLLMEDLKTPSHRPRDSTDTLLDRNIKQLGDFCILKKIGHGGMGIVYAAQQQSLDRPVAMKVFAPTLFSSDRMMRRFKREAKAAGALHHSNIVPVLGVGQQWGIHYYIMQLIDGKSLDKVIQSSPKKMFTESIFRLQRDWRKIADIGRQLMSALHYAHSRNVLHRDIKPANLILDREGTAWITDFGLAKLTTEENITKTGQAIGTLRYMSPEQLEGQVDERSDIYSLGLTLYELLTWKPAFAESDHGRLVHKKTSELPVRPRVVDRSIPRDLETIVLKTIARDPAHRYGTAREVEEDLERFLNDEPIMARRVSAAERFVRWSRRNQALALACALVATLAATFVLLLLWGYVHLQNSLAREQAERRRATTNAALAMSALDSVFDRFGIDNLTKVDRTGEPMLSSEAAVLLEDLLRYYEALAQQEANGPAVLLQAAKAQLTIGNIRQRLGEYWPTITAYQNAIEKFQRLSESNENDVTIASILNHMGWVQRTHGAEAQGQTNHAEAKSILETSLANAADVSEGHRARMRYQLARTLFLIGRRIRPGMGPSSLPPLSAINELANVANGERRQTKIAGNLPAAFTSPDKDLLEKAISLLRDLNSARDASPASRQLLARCLIERVGDDLGHRDRDDSESEARGLEILESLVNAFPGDSDYEFDLVESLAEFSVFGHAMNPSMTAEAESRLRRAVTHGESLVSRRPDVARFALVVAHAHFKLAAVLEYQADLKGQDVETRELDAAKDELNRAIDMLVELRSRFPGSKGFAVWHAYFEIRNMIIHQKLQRPGGVREAKAQATTILSSLESTELIEKLLGFCHNP